MIELLPEVLNLATEWRHRLHAMPELSYEEHQTAALIRGELQQMGIPFTAGVPGAPTATVGLIGDESKPCLALRADIDALPITEETSLTYASQHAGRMHACGHDGHTAILLGAAAVLQKCASSLPVCVKLIFQPAEETGGGAERMVSGGVLDGRLGPRVRCVFGLHGWPTLSLGMVSTRPGALLAATDTFAVSFTGKGCHGAYPHLGKDPIVAACEAVLNLQQCVSRELDPTEPGLVTVGTIQAGTAVNIIPDTASISGTVRSLSAGARNLLKTSLERRCQHVATAQGCEATLEWQEGYPATVNDAGMADYVARIAKSALGELQFQSAERPSMGGEDFAYYLEEVPGCFFLLGVCPPNSRCPSLHSNCFNFPDAALEAGIRMFVALASNFQTDS